MKLTVIGPWGAYPKAGDATASYLLEVDDQKILIDCGSGVLSNLQKFLPIHELTAVFVSHQHFDHVADLGCLQHACLIDSDLFKRQHALPIYVAQEGEESLPYKVIKGSTPLPIDHNSHITIGNIKLSFFRTFHEVYCLGMRIEHDGKVIVLTADTYYDESLVEHCNKADLLVAETSFYASFEARKFGHMNTVEVAILATKSNAKSLILTHLPHFGEIEQLVEEVEMGYKGGVELAKTGLTVEQ